MNSSDALASVVLIGATNVGKSSIYNRLTKSNDALVADVEHLTRDLRPGLVKNLAKTSAFLLYDTAGIEFKNSTDLDKIIHSKVMEIIKKASIILFVFDAQQGINSVDIQLVEYIRKSNAKVLLIANKVDGVNVNRALVDASELGIKSEYFCPISALQNRGISDLNNKIFGKFAQDNVAVFPIEELDTQTPSIVFCGRPNSGKSTLMNAITQSARSIVSNVERSTRDEVRAMHQINGIDWQLIDTAGVFASWRTDRSINKLTALRTLALVERANIAVVMMDVQEGITKQDRALVSRAVSSGRSAIVLLNKIDLLHQHLRKKMIDDLKYDLSYSTEKYVEVIGVSAKKQLNLEALFDSLKVIHGQQHKELPTSLINRVLQQIIKQTPPPAGRGNRQIKLKFGNLASSNPHIIQIFGNQTELLPQNYISYLHSQFQQLLGINYIPIKLKFTDSNNPYAGQTNELSERQFRRRKRMIVERKKRDR